MISEVFERIKKEDLSNCAKITYTNECKKIGNMLGFGLKKIQDGSEPIVVIINGFLNQNETDTSEWEDSLKYIWKNNSWYLVNWESKQLSHYITKGELIWTKAKNNTEKVGRILAETLHNHDRNYILCGHSLGARVIFYTLKHLSSLTDKKIIKEVHLLGGAVTSSTKEWQKLLYNIDDSIYNYYSKHDDVLKKVYKLGTFFADEPIGVNKIIHHKIINIDTSSRVKGHSGYKKYLFKFYPKKENNNIIQIKINLRSKNAK